MAKPSYKSKFEQHIHQLIGKTFSYEPFEIDYTVPESFHKYTPDFVKGKTVYETKGRLTLHDRKKMLLVKQQNPTYKFVFIFQNPNLPIRKGSKTTYKDWAEKNGFDVIDARSLK